MGVLCLSLFCYSLFYVLSSFAIILKRKRESWLLCLYCLADVLLLYMFCVLYYKYNNDKDIFPDATYIHVNDLNTLSEH